LKKAFLDWYTGDFKTKDPQKIFIIVFHGAEDYSARELLDLVLRPPLLFCLIRETRIQLRSTGHQHLHDSEVVFLNKVPKEDVQFQLSLQELFDSGLTDILPELCEKDAVSNSFLGPTEV
jgi:hypothetical protein